MNMKKLMRDNPTIVFGIGLPIVFAVLFLLISGVPTLLVPTAQYDVLYASNYGYYGNTQDVVQVAVVGNQVHMNYIGNKLPSSRPRLWRFNPKTGAVKEIQFFLPSGLTSSRENLVEKTAPSMVMPIEVPDLVELKVDSSSLAPDGYRFDSGVDNYSRDGFASLFYPSRYRYQAQLVKNGHRIRLPSVDQNDYGRRIHFIGWVVSP